jgi:N-acetylglucosamine kinase-like BadF-type ATPase
LLTDKILAFYSTATPQELKSAVNLNNISKLTYLVREAADEGDTAAQIIISEAAQQLAQMASVVITRLGMNTAASELALTGGLARIGERFTGPFGKRLTELCPEIRQVEPLLSPAGGALLLAFRACGIPWSDELLAALKQTI